MPTLPDADVVLASYLRPPLKGVLRFISREGAKAIFIQNYEMEEGKPNAKLDASWRMPFHKITISEMAGRTRQARSSGDAVVSCAKQCETGVNSMLDKEKQPVPTLACCIIFSCEGLKTSLRASVLQRSYRVCLIGHGAEGPDFSYLSYASSITARDKTCSPAVIDAICWLCGVEANVEGFHLPPWRRWPLSLPWYVTRVGGPFRYE